MPLGFRRGGRGAGLGGGPCGRPPCLVLHASQARRLLTRGRPQGPPPHLRSAPAPTGRAASFSLVSARPAAGCSYVAPVASFANSFYNALDQRCPWTWLQDRQVVAARLAGKPLPI